VLEEQALHHQHTKRKPVQNVHLPKVILLLENACPISFAQRIQNLKVFEAEKIYNHYIESSIPSALALLFVIWFYIFLLLIFFS